MAVLTPSPKMQFESAAGVPLSGGKVYTYAAGTTTPQATYTDASGSTANPNPVILNSRGEAAIWLGSASYKFKLTDANDVEIWTVDYISAPTSGISPVLSGNVTIDSDTPGVALKITQTGTGAVLRVQDSADPDTTPFIIDNSGNPGLGTATPSAQLEATGAVKIGSLTLTTAPLPVASGGTNATTAAAARTSLALSSTDNVTFNTVTDAKGEVRRAPLLYPGSGATLDVSYAGRTALLSGGATIPSGVFSAGDMITIANFTGSSQTITQGASLILYLGGANGASGSRTLLNAGIATVLFTSANNCVISGAGLL